MSNTSFCGKKFRHKSIIKNTARNIVIQHFDPVLDIGPEIEFFKAAVNKIPFNSFEGFLEVYKKSDSRNVVLKLMYLNSHFPVRLGSDETKNECLKSLMATYLFRQKVSHYGSLGVNFREPLYVPEVDSTGEDHNHLLKCIAACTRSGGEPGINLQCFTKALNDPATGLTYTALTGQHKQSVPDCERLLSPAMAKFMKSRGYTEEARFI